MNMKETELLILGASAYGLAAACRWGENCLVAEEGTSAGAEYADAMIANPISLAKTGLPVTDSLTEEFLKRGAADRDGNLHILAVGPILTKRYYESGCRILCGTRWISTEQVTGGYRVTLFHPKNGFTTVMAGKVLDTCVRPGMRCQKSLGMLLCGDDTLPLFDDGTFYLLRGAFPDERILRVRLPADADEPAGQELLDRFPAEHPERIGRAKAAGPALVFGYTFDTPLGHVSASFGDVISAVREGERAWN